MPAMTCSLEHSRQPRLSTTLSLRSGDRIWGTERRMALLAAIDTEGSITAAARKVGLSYKAAWDAVDIMNNASDRLLVERVTGGWRGGGANLTTHAKALLAWYQAVLAEHQRFTEVLLRLDPDSPRHLDLLRNMALQTSARNCIRGTVTAIEPGRVNNLIHLRTESGTVLTATITQASTERMTLSAGRHALAFIKAQAVTIEPATGPSTARHNRPASADGAGATNEWTGTVGHIVRGDGADEVSLDISPQLRIVGLSAPGAITRNRVRAQARFKSSDVLIGTVD